MSEPLHEEVCFPCWLQALGVDEPLGVALIFTAFHAGLGAGAGAVARDAGLPIAAAIAATIGTKMSAEQFARIGAGVRQMMAAPVSPDVAAAMSGHGHGHR